MWSNSLSEKEAEYSRVAFEALKTCAWTRTLIQELSNGAGELILNSSMLPRLFELRFAHQLFTLGLLAEYEYSSGADGTVDFMVRTQGNTVWLFELLTVCQSKAVKEAIKIEDVIAGVEVSELCLSTENGKASEEGEMLLVQQKIGEKVFRDGRAVKFSERRPNVYQIIIVNSRGFLDGNADQFDYQHIVLGPRGLEPQYCRFWEDKPIRGVFEVKNPQRYASYLRDRIDFIGFVNETEFCDDEILRKIFYLPNRHLLGTDDAIKSVYERLPIKRR